MASVFLGDLDDFIQPSQSCINPMFTDQTEAAATAATSTTSNGGGGGGVAMISIESDVMMVEPDLIRTNTNSKTATVSLSDCLACSGCVTSAETVLITQQSVHEFLKTLDTLQQTKTQPFKVVVSLAPQACAAIATHFKLSCADAQLKLRTFFRQLGVDMLLDTTSSGDFSLIEAAHEFVVRYRNQAPLEWKQPPVSFAESSSKTLYPQGGQDTEANPYSAIPMLASACPGFVCYAEKSQQHVLPYISTTKSPQQIMGTLVKHVIFAAQRIPAQSIYHVSIMPCFDKKLEASRKDFYDDLSSSRDVDTVLTSQEVIELLEMKQTDLKALDETRPTGQEEVLLTSTSTDGHSLFGASTAEHVGSGGYLEYIFRYAALELFGIHVPDGPLSYEQGRNQDIRHVQLCDPTRGQVVLSFAQAFGFRNIQGIVTKIRRKKCAYHFVEIMACPGGCLNGGGQIRGAELTRVKQTFLQRIVRRATDNPACREWYPTQFDQPFSDKARQFLHTRYHAVPKLELLNPLGIKW